MELWVGMLQTLAVAKLERKFIWGEATTGKVIVRHTVHFQRITPFKNSKAVSRNLNNIVHPVFKACHVVSKVNVDNRLDTNDVPSVTKVLLEFGWGNVWDV